MDDIISLLDFTLSNNYFIYNDVTYKQIHGCATGSPVSTVARLLHFWSQIVISVATKTMKTKSKYKEKRRALLKVWLQKCSNLATVPVSPVVANICMEVIENTAIETTPTKTKTWKRFVDDSFSIIKKTAIISFLNSLNNIDPNITKHTH